VVSSTQSGRSEDVNTATVTSQGVAESMGRILQAADVRVMDADRHARFQAELAATSSSQPQPQPAFAASSSPTASPSKARKPLKYTDLESQVVALKVRSHWSCLRDGLCGCVLRVAHVSNVFCHADATS